MRRIVAILLFAAPWLTLNAHAAELKPKTRAGFDHYVQVANARIQAELAASAKGAPFLDFELKDAAQQRAIRDQLSKGETVIEKVVEKENGKNIDDIPDGIIHHWRATVFIPGADLKSTVVLISDYNNNKNVYKPEVVDSRLLSKKVIDPNTTEFHAFLRFYKKKILAVTLNTEHDALYTVLSPTREIESSHTVRVAQVDAAGTPNEREKPVGNDDGFMWALNSYWRLEQKDGGTYVQCEAISLTRDIPTGLGWIVKPFITDVPKESLHTTMDQTRAWMMKGKK
jgi:hypothetical protein